MGGMGGIIPPHFSGKKFYPPHLGGTAQTQKSVFFEGFLRFQVRESFKNIEKNDFWAAPAAGCGKKSNYRYFSVILEISIPPILGPPGPNRGANPPHPESKK